MEMVRSCLILLLGIGLIGTVCSDLQLIASQSHSNLRDSQSHKIQIRSAAHARSAKNKKDAVTSEIFADLNVAVSDIGTRANVNEYPWQAFLMLFSSSSSATPDSVCGGSLIGNRWILTTATCLHGMAKIVVYLGINDISLTSEPNRMVFTSTSFFKHPDWSKEKVYRANIGLIQLPTTIKSSNSNVKPILLPFKNNESNYIAKTVHYSGWGTQSGNGSTGTLSAYLLKTTTSVISNYDCSVVYGNNVVSSDVICTKAASNGRGICPGDNGGPMFYINPSGSFTQIGIASFFAATGCSVGHPSGFTRINSYLNWISSKTGINESSGASPAVNQQLFVWTKSVVNLMLPLVGGFILQHHLF